MNKTNKNIIECGEETVAIQVIGRGQQTTNYGLVYAASKSKPRFGKGHIIEGKISVELFINSGKITLRSAHDS